MVVKCPLARTAFTLPFPPQLVAEHSERGGGQGKDRQGAAHTLGQVSVGVLPQHSGAAEEQQWGQIHLRRSSQKRLKYGTGAFGVMSGFTCMSYVHLAFGFCLEYQRRTEFRKLCDIVSCTYLT